jgi:diacylglycerol kinase (ATP)
VCAPVRIALVANAASGRGLDPAPLAQVLESHGAQVTVCAPDDAGLREAEDSRPDRLAVASGDGTIARVASLAGRLEVPLAVIPGGTANDFARFNDLPGDTEQACAAAATSERTRPLELGRLADGRPFVNVASAGLASVAARRAHPLKPRLGALAYAVGALRAAASERPLQCRVRAGGDDVYAGGAWQVIIACTGAFGAGSGVGAADPSDGVLDVTILPAGSRLGLARRAWGLRRRTIAAQRDVVHERAATVEVELPPGAVLNVDGELHDGGMERVTVEKDAFRLVLP